MKIYLILAAILSIPAAASADLDISVQLSGGNLRAGQSAPIVVTAKRNGVPVEGLRFCATVSGAGMIPISPVWASIGEVKAGLVVQPHIATDEEGRAVFSLVSNETERGPTLVTVSCLDSNFTSVVPLRFYGSPTQEVLSCIFSSRPFNTGPDSVVTLTITHADGNPVQMQEDLQVEWTSTDGLEFPHGSTSIASPSDNGCFETVVTGSVSGKSVNAVVTYSVVPGARAALLLLSHTF